MSKKVGFPEITSRPDAPDMKPPRNEDEIVTLHFEFNLGELKNLVQDAVDLNENSAFFAKLAELQEIRDAFKSADEKLDKLQADVKGAINARAKALYGPTWQAIAGDGYKINRSPTGSVYGLMPDIKPNKKFIKIVESIDKDAVEAYVKENSKLPKGIDYNPNRGESIVIRIKK